MALEDPTVNLTKVLLGAFISVTSLFGLVVAGSVLVLGAVAPTLLGLAFLVKGLFE